MVPLTIKRGNEQTPTKSIPDTLHANNRMRYGDFDGARNSRVSERSLRPQLRNDMLFEVAGRSTQSAVHR